jgi:hypothetical protein
MPFRRGDVFAVLGGGVEEYTPTGQLVQTLPGTSGASVLCFDPSGQHLILPGVGLFDTSGDVLSSNWSRVKSDGSDCVADGRGNVYTSSEMPDSSWVITKYDLNGNVRQIFPLAFRAATPMAMDLAPDECTMYYGAFVHSSTGLGPLNVCTGTSESGFDWGAVDDLRVLPNWQFLSLSDYGGRILDPPAPAQGYSVPGSSGSLRHLALDSDGTSFWACCAIDFNTNPSPPFVYNIYRFGIHSGQMLAEWPLTAGAIAVYSPPLLGNASVTGAVQSNQAGTAETFPTRVRYSGRLTRVHLYVDSSSTANQVVVGIYANDGGRPGELLERGTITNPRPNSWAYLDVPSTPVTAGQVYWVAVLGPDGGGTAAFRDGTPGLAIASARHNLTDLPARWSGGRWTSSGSLSAYGS